MGTYQNSGLSGYTVAPGVLPNNQSVVYGAQGPNFPVQWSPRYAFAVSGGVSLVAVEALDGVMVVIFERCADNGFSLICHLLIVHRRVRALPPIGELRFDVKGQLIVLLSGAWAQAGIVLHQQGWP